MTDMEMRFHRDMLVLSGSLTATLQRQGANPQVEGPHLTLVEPDTLEEAYRLQALAGAQCMVTPTESIAPARLAHSGFEGDLQDLARAAVGIVETTKPQHVLAEIGPCGLPLDATSKGSLNENRSQYADGARAFEGLAIDAFLLSGFTSIADMKCALMGVAQVSDHPILASMLVGESTIYDSPLPEAPSSDFALEDIGNGLPTAGFQAIEVPEAPRTDPGRGRIDPLSGERWPEAVEAMVDLGAAVVGFETAEPKARALLYAKQAAASELPLAAFLRVVEDPMDARAKGLVPLEDIDEYTPDTLPGVAMTLRDAGVQFLRATGDATPACTGALCATVSGLDAVVPWR